MATKIAKRRDVKTEAGVQRSWLLVTASALVLVASTARAQSDSTRLITTASLDVGLGFASSGSLAGFVGGWAAANRVAIGVRASAANAGNSMDSSGIQDVAFLVGPSFSGRAGSIVIGVGIDRVGGVSGSAPYYPVLPTGTGFATHVSATKLVREHVGLGITFLGADGHAVHYTVFALTARIGKLR